MPRFLLKQKWELPVDIFEYYFLKKSCFHSSFFVKEFDQKEIENKIFICLLKSQQNKRMQRIYQENCFNKMPLQKRQYLVSHFLFLRSL